jgi:hypothetical protein
MKSEYKYRPPLKYLFVGLGGLLAASIFLLTIFKSGVWFAFVMGFFFLMSLAMGVGFLALYIYKFKSGNLVLTEDYIEMPNRWKKRIRLNFNEIIDIGEFDTYDNVVVIETKRGDHLIERAWMNKNDFELFKNELQDYWTKENIAKQNEIN